MILGRNFRERLLHVKQEKAENLKQSRHVD